MQKNEGGVFVDQIVKAIVDFTNWLWGPPLMIILAGGGLFLTIRLGFSSSGICSTCGDRRSDR